MDPICKNSLGCCWNHCHTLDIIQSKSISLQQFLEADNMATHANGFHLNHPHTFEMADKSEKHSRSAYTLILLSLDKLHLKFLCT
jgi:hypothetical protein